MKKLLPLLLALCLLLCACGAAQEEPTEPTTTEPETTVEVTTEEITEPPTTEAPVIRNPLNGEEISEPYTGRIFASTINNVSPALPYQGVSQADMLFEMLINDNATRCVALFSNVQSLPGIRRSFGTCRLRQWRPGHSE